MANGYLKTTALGNLGADPELRQTQGGMAVLNLRLACNLRVKKSGEWVDEATWIGVTTFGNRAEALAKILAKGQTILASGRLEIREYEKRDGGKGTAVSIVADEIVLTGGKRDGQQRRPAPEPSGGDAYAGEANSYTDSFSDDDLPF